MRKYLKRVPLTLTAGLLAVMLVAGGVFAYNFMQVNMELEVREPMVVSIDYENDGNWVALDSNTLPLSDWGMAGDSRTFGLKVENKANGSINVDAVKTGSGYVSLSGLPSGSIAGETTWTGDVTASISASAPPGDYVVTVTFDRS